MKKYLEQKGVQFQMGNEVIDNLDKGASGQAIQNMNILFGMDEWLGF
jgi:N-acetyl-gamma-glutamylphosphate reductase